eukprot:CAMPEP_0168317096 /NCGR_PEP_ID=MMETSP0210-20121227/22548_1 /TAXON_ID=40633 /ORGANISM="Condylostoma magnum, Strain COL2" /LENGTH=41 /DNA_ID= /DNA_START= /DNA_END= /DNA_ORIENTATION=
MLKYDAEFRDLNPPIVEEEENEEEEEEEKEEIPRLTKEEID